MRLSTDITGNRYGRWTVIKRSERKDKYGKSIWICKCDCGNIKEVQRGNLVSGYSKSCGCLKIEISIEKIVKFSTSHGFSKRKNRSPTYKSWLSMKQRCYTEKRKNFKNYGGRGIYVCDRWKNSFENFLLDMGERPPGTSLDRIDVNGNYEPSNCRWADSETQYNNTRRNVYVNYEGNKVTLAQLSRITGVKYSKLRSIYYSTSNSS